MAEKILVVDDDLDTLRLVGMMLERQGFTIFAASGGRQALEMARSEKPDLIVLDLMMPDIDGLQVARELRSDPETQNMLIIMFTARTQMEDKLQGFDVGADDYLTKPIQPRELIAHVRAVLKRSGAVHAALPAISRTRGKLIGALAAKGGMGASTLAINTAIALHKLSKKSVIATDFRPGCGTIGLELGLDNPQGLNQLLALTPAAIDAVAVEAALVEHPAGVRLLLSSSDPADARGIVEVDRFAAIAGRLPFLADYAVVDLGASLTPPVQKTLAEFDRLMLIFEPVGQTVTQARELSRRLVEAGCEAGRILPVLVNRQRAGIQLSLGQVQDMYGGAVAQVFTAVPELAYQSQTANTPMILRQAEGVTAQQFTALAQMVL